MKYGRNFILNMILEKNKVNRKCSLYICVVKDRRELIMVYFIDIWIGMVV